MSDQLTGLTGPASAMLVNSALLLSLKMLCGIFGFVYNFFFFININSIFILKA